MPPQTSRCPPGPKLTPQPAACRPLPHRKKTGCAGSRQPPDVERRPGHTPQSARVPTKSGHAAAAAAAFSRRQTGKDAKGRRHAHLHHSPSCRRREHALDAKHPRCWEGPSHHAASRWLHPIWPAARAAPARHQLPGCRGRRTGLLAAAGIAAPAKAVPPRWCCCEARARWAEERANLPHVQPASVVAPARARAALRTKAPDPWPT
eukprot:scaffold3854_cov107-Isochrysis_galbana.AAC.16